MSCGKSLSQDLPKAEKTPEEEEDLPKILNCVHCGNDLRENSKFCNNCGKPIS